MTAEVLYERLHNRQGYRVLAARIGGYLEVWPEEGVEAWLISEAEFRRLDEMIDRRCRALIRE